MPSTAAQPTIPPKAPASGSDHRTRPSYIGGGGPAFCARHRCGHAGPLLDDPWVDERWVHVPQRSPLPWGARGETIAG
jgi:hypothetical protein